MTFEINHPVVGVAHTENYIYVAYAIDLNGINITHALRFLADGTLDNTWQTTLSEHNQYRYRQLDIRGDENDPEINLPLVSEIIHNASPDGKALTLLLPPRGGYGDWHYGNTHINMPPMMQPTETSKSAPKILSTTDILDFRNNDHNNLKEKDSNATVAGSVAILVPIAITGILGAKTLCDKCSLKKIACDEINKVGKMSSDHWRPLLSVVRTWQWLKK